MKEPEIIRSYWDDTFDSMSLAKMFTDYDTGNRELIFHDDRVVISFDIFRDLDHQMQLTVTYFFRNKVLVFHNNTSGDLIDALVLNPSGLEPRGCALLILSMVITYLRKVL